MYLHILKKDLKRKKTMNCIILLFVILSTMFFASSVNNILSVIGGIDRYLDMAGMKEQVAVMLESNSGEPLADELRSNDKVRDFNREEVLFFVPEKLTCGETVVENFSQMVLSSVDKLQVNCYDLNNKKITSVEPGTVMMTSFAADKLNAEVGDIVEITICGETFTLEMAGICKDAVLGSSMVGCPRYILNNNDFESLSAIDAVRQSCRAGVYLIDTDSDTASDIFSNVSGCQFHVARSVIKLSYMPEMMTAGIIMVVSIFLILISFVVLRFTIGFTIQEEFREIGVMKAIGLRSSSIRLLYLTKYLGIAVVGALIGFAASFPFGRILMDSVSRSMVLGNDHPILSGIVCTLLIIGIVVLFSYGCTSKIKKLTPVDAVRSGQTGERFHRHGSLRLSRSPLGASGFLSLNSVVSAPKQSAILIIVFTLCAMLVMIESNMAATFTSPKMLSICSLTESDLYLDSPTYSGKIIRGEMTFDEVNEEIEQKLAENGMPADVITKGTYNTAVSFGDRSSTVRFLHCSEMPVSYYTYSEGTPPQNPNEIAISTLASEELGAKIGDTVHISMTGDEGDYIVTALFDTMNNLGMTGYFYEGAEPPLASIQWADCHLINFTDDPDQEIIEARRSKVHEIFDTKKVYTIEEYVDICLGSAGGTFISVRNLTMAVSIIIILLMTVLLERSFISKEHTEIALMKAVGFRNRSVVGIHVLRFIIIAAASVVIAAAVSAPMTRLIIGPLYKALGSVRTIIVSIDPIDNFVILPAIVLTVVVISAALTALYTGSVKASDTANIE
ncbi:MAG: ABC transporter permease [Ruminococcus sp.]|nr:ABC transporter permease [Ruminococcus sp.]